MKKRFKKAFKTAISVMLVIATVLALCACGGKKDDGGKTSGDGTEGSSKEDKNKTELVVWHLWGTGTTGVILKELAQKFTDSQDKYKVTILQQGSAVNQRQKLATLEPEEFPALICGTPSATCYYENLSYIKPLQDFLDADEDNWDEALFPNVRTAYSNREGRMIGAPLGVSCSGYYVNVDILKKAGHQLSELTSMEKIVDIAIDVYQKGLIKYGITFGSKNVDLADLLTIQGIDMVNSGNGYDGKVTKSLLSEGETKAMTEKYLQLVAKACDSGSGQKFNATAMSSFCNGNTAFHCATNSYYQDIMLKKPDFEWAFIPFPGIDDGAKYKNCALTEGTGWYIPDSKDETSMQGAYEFVKFMCSTESQVTFSVNTGYIPYTQEAFENQEYVDFVNKNCPSFASLHEKMANAPADMRLPYTFAWDNVLDATSYLLDNVTNHPENDIGKYMDQATKTLDDAITVALMRYRNK